MHSYTEKNFWVAKARNGLASSNTAKETLEETIWRFWIMLTHHSGLC